MKEKVIKSLEAFESLIRNKFDVFVYLRQNTDIVLAWLSHDTLFQSLLCPFHCRMCHRVIWYHAIKGLVYIMPLQWAIGIDQTDWLSRLCELRFNRSGQRSSSVAGSWQPNNNSSLHIGGSGNHIKTAPYIGLYFFQRPWACSSQGRYYRHHAYHIEGLN